MFWNFSIGLKSFTKATSLVYLVNIAFWEGKWFFFSTELWCMELYRMIAYSAPKVICTNLPEQREIVVSQVTDSIPSLAYVFRPASVWLIRFAHAFWFGLRYAVVHFVLHKPLPLFPYPNPLNWPLCPFKIWFGWKALGCSHTVEASPLAMIMTYCQLGFW
jgi:hypothetical protein